MIDDPRYDDSPLNDPDYKPVHPPVHGKPPSILRKWGPRSQLRWFKRFWGTAAMQMVRPSEVTDLHCESIHHTGMCCSTCLDEIENGQDALDAGQCCCRAIKHDG